MSSGVRWGLTVGTERSAGITSHLKYNQRADHVFHEDHMAGFLSCGLDEGLLVAAV